MTEIAHAIAAAYEHALGHRPKKTSMHQPRLESRLHARPRVAQALSCELELPLERFQAGG
jgi:hypothetical protein